MKQRKSYLKVGSSFPWKTVLIIGGIIALTAILIIGVMGMDIDLSGFGNSIKAYWLNFIHWIENIFSDFSVNLAQIAVLIIAGIAAICFLKNPVLLITATFYGIVFFLTLGGVNLMNSYWFWILILIAELIAIIATYFFTGDSFGSCCSGAFIQLFVLVPVWFILGCLCLSAAEKENAELENLFYLILQFVTFAVVLGYQLIIMFSHSDNGLSTRDPVIDITDDDTDWDDL